MPSQQQVRWSQLRVGITVIISATALAVLIILMSGTGGVFSKRITLKSKFVNTGGLRVGSLVSLQGVNIGNVTAIKIAPGVKDTPVEVTMKINTEYLDSIKKDSVAALSSAGVLGDLFVDINSKDTKLGTVVDGDVLKSTEHPAIDDLFKAGQNALQNADVLLKRIDGIVAEIESGKGSIGLLLKDPGMYERANKVLGEMSILMTEINQGKGSIGKLLKNDEMYNKVMKSIDQVAKMIDDINAGKGNAGKLLKDEQLYKNVNETMASANKLLADINQGHGTMGKVLHDEEFAKKVDNMVTKLSSLSSRMDAGEGSVGKLFTDPSLYNSADKMLVETRSLVQAMRENPKKYLTIHVKLF